MTRFAGFFTFHLPSDTTSIPKPRPFRKSATAIARASPEAIHNPTQAKRKNRLNPNAIWV